MGNGSTRRAAKRLSSRVSYTSGSVMLSFMVGVGISDPATFEELGTVPDMGVGETRQAIEAADRALPAWSRTTAKVRFAYFVRFESFNTLLLASTRSPPKVSCAYEGAPRRFRASYCQ